jgi:hypothetical protein
LSSRASARLAFAVGVSVWAALVVSSCYRAEIDLTPLLSDPQSVMGGSSGDGSVPLAGGAPEPMGGSGGSSMPMAGAGQEATAGAGGAACDDAPLDAVQSGCLLLEPTVAECDDQPADGWAGCYAGGCMACTPQTKLVPGFPYYFKWHPCCQPNTTCSNHPPQVCNARCPAPTEHDTVPPCAVLATAPN